MKTQIKLLIALVMTMASSVALATPTYSDPVEGTFNANCGQGLYPSQSAPGGFWIWTVGDGNWSIRWSPGGVLAFHHFSDVITVHNDRF